MEESGLLGQLGINLGLFVSQAVNFFILLVVLTFFVYKPLIKIIKNRNTKIEEGLKKAEQADVRLKEIDNICKEKIKETEIKSIEILKETEKKAKVLGDALIEKAENREREMMEQIKKNATRAQEEANKIVLNKAADLVRKAIVKTVELDPDKIDEALIKKVVVFIKNEQN